MSSQRVLVMLAEGCEEIEVVTVIDVLRRAGLDVVAAGLTAGPLRASRGVRIVPDSTLDEVQNEDFALVVVPGGMGGAKALCADATVKAILDGARSRKRWIGAICAAPAIVLGPLGHLEGHRATGHPSTKSQMAQWLDMRVVTSGLLVTSQGPGTALEFSLTLVHHLCGEAKAREVATPMLARWEP